MKALRRLFKKSRPNASSSNGAGFYPSFPKPPSKEKLVEAVAEFYHRTSEEVESWYDNYYRLHRKMKYKKRFSELKTLCFSEAFVIFAGLAVSRPERIIEIGTQHGKSTRRILDMRDLLGLSSEVVSYDLVDLVQHFSKDEVTLKLEDLTGQFHERVMKEDPPGLIYLDAHPWALLTEVMSDILAGSSDTILTIHDLGRGLCNPEMLISKEAPEEITSLTGHWERHALAAVTGVSDALSTELDKMETETHRIRIFDTPHGFAAIAPLSMVTS